MHGSLGGLLPGPTARHGHGARLQMQCPQDKRAPLCACWEAPGLSNFYQARTEGKSRRNCPRSDHKPVSSNAVLECIDDATGVP